MFHLLVHDDILNDWHYIGVYGDRGMAHRTGNEFGNYMIIEGLIVEKVLLPIDDEDYDCRNVPH